MENTKRGGFAGMCGRTGEASGEKDTGVHENPWRRADQASLKEGKKNAGKVRGMGNSWDEKGGLHSRVTKKKKRARKKGKKSNRNSRTSWVTISKE